MILSALLSDGMVLQREQKVKIWGISKSNCEITIQFLGKSYQTTANNQGEWEIIFENLQPGGPYEMELSDGVPVMIHDILIGDVWLLGGQSNMELPIRRTLDLYESEVTRVQENHIRMFSVLQSYNFHEPQKEIYTGKWVSVTPEDVMDFSAVGYFFGKELHESYGVPIGLLQAAVGGTPAEAWVSERSLLSLGGFEQEINKCRDDNYVSATIEYEANRNNQWYHKLIENDPGLKDNKWYLDDVDISQWKNISIPGMFKDRKLRDWCGSVWLRKEFIIPETVFNGSNLGKDSFKEELHDYVKLSLGTLVDADDTYVNGIFVGNTGYKYPPRKYTFPKSVLRSGKNTITVRLICNQGNGGFVPDKLYQLNIGKHVIDLRGSWNYHIGAWSESLEPTTFFQYKPRGVYNGMIFPLRKYGIRGVAYYQGESNTGNPKGYRKLFTALIEDWRKLWNQGDFPFLYVQLAGYGNYVKSWANSGLADIREEQRQCLHINNTSMAVSIDIGEYNDLHPQNKKTVGHRLALCAKNIAYGEKIVCSGPIYERKQRLDNKIQLYFKHVGSGLIAVDGSLRQFTICGEDGNYVPAFAVIEKDTVIVSSHEVQNPQCVRYAWGDNPEEANLYNKEGLPASPFMA